jgi:hypothetical protein
MQRTCSAALLAIDGSQSGVGCCVGIGEGFKSPILHSKPLREIADGLFYWS